MDLVTLNQLDFSPLLFFPLVGIFGFLGGIVNSVVGVVKGVVGLGSKNTSSTSSSANFQTLYQQSRAQVLNLQAQLAEKKKTDWIPIAVIGGIGLMGIFLFMRK